MVFFYGFLIFPMLPKLTLPIKVPLENLLLPFEVGRWIQSECFGNRRGRMFEAEGYQLNSSVLAQ
jgi:hypothetical protein